MTELIGKTVGRYRVEALLGRGGMGEVWRARDPVLHREVALKILPPEFAALPDASRRFRREAQAASAMRHQGIAAVFDAGDEDGRLYIAFELVDGVSVAEILEARGPLPVGLAVRIATQAAKALAHAHSRGVVHRDVTPGNLMVTEEDRVVVVDFGLAVPDGATRFTITGAAVGTAAYMAPEVGRGERGDAAADVYGLGAVLYEMLTGQPPFTGERSPDILKAAMKDPVAPPRAMRADLPGDVEAIVMRCLAKKPGDRYPGAEDLGAELGRVEARLSEALESGIGGGRGTVRILRSAAGKGGRKPGSRVHSLLRSVGSSSLIPVRLPRWAELLVSIAVLLMAAGAFRMADPFGWWTPGPYESVAVLPFVNRSETGEGDYLRLGLGRGLASRLARHPSLRVIPWSTSNTYHPAVAPGEAARDLGVEVILLGSFHREQDRIRTLVTIYDRSREKVVWRGEFSSDVQGFLHLESEVALDVTRRLVGGMSDDVKQMIARPPTPNPVAWDYYLQGMARFQSEGSEEANLAAQALFKKALDEDPRLAAAHVGIGATANERFFMFYEGGVGNLEVAEEHFRDALALQPGMTEALRGLVHAYARGPKRDVLALVEEVQGDGTEDLLVKGEAYLFGGLPSRAVPLFETILEQDPANVTASFYQVLACTWSGRFARAREAGEYYLRNFGENPEIHIWMGVVAQELGDEEGAGYHYEAGAQGSPERGDFFLAGYLMQIGEETRARGIAARALADRVRSLSRYSDNPRARIEKATGHALLGERTEFETEALRLRSKDLVGFPDLLDTLAQCYAYLGEYEEAAEVLREALGLGVVSEATFAYRRSVQALGDLATSAKYQDLRAEWAAALTRLHEEF